MQFKFGDIALVKFPFTGTNNFKKRPALILLDAKDDDVVVCRITSARCFSKFDIQINNWQQLGLLSLSIIRVHKIATLEKGIIERKIATLDKSLSKLIANTFENAKKYSAVQMHFSNILFIIKFENKKLWQKNYHRKLK